MNLNFVQYFMTCSKQVKEICCSLGLIFFIPFFFLLTFCYCLFFSAVQLELHERCKRVCFRGSQNKLHSALIYKRKWCILHQSRRRYLFDNVCGHTCYFVGVFLLIDFFVFLAYEGH